MSIFTFGFSFFWLMFWMTQQENKKPPTFIRRRNFRGDFLFRRSLSRTSTLSGQGTLSFPTTGCRIRFFESLLMLRYTNRRAEEVCQVRHSPEQVARTRTPRCLHCLNGNPLGLTKLRSIALASEANARWNLVIPVRAFELFGDLVGQRPKQLRTGVTREGFC
jgi:hypothetical protein